MIEKAFELPWYIQIIRGMPTPPILYRTDTSTGVGQIFAETAIEATNSWTKKNGINSEHRYDKTNWKDLEEFWLKLQYDDGYNIDMIGRVLDYKRDLLIEGGFSDPTPRQIMQRYNGGDSNKYAIAYGKVTEKYYNAFKQFNAEN